MRIPGLLFGKRVRLGKWKKLNVERASRSHSSTQKRTASCGGGNRERKDVARLQLMSVFTRWIVCEGPTDVASRVQMLGYAICTLL